VTSPLRLTTSNFIFQLNSCDYSPYETSSLTRDWVCRLQLLLVLASAAILRPEFRGTHDHTLLSQIRDSPKLEDQVPVFISPRNMWPGYTPRHWVSFSSPPTTRKATVEVFDTASTSLSLILRPTISRPVCLGIKQMGLQPDFYYCQTVAGLLMWGALSDERTGLWSTIAPGPRQHSHFRVRLSCSSAPEFAWRDTQIAWWSHKPTCI
jgi:hypothetical protein